MIRVYKRNEEPETLRTRGYKDDKVKRALLEDQHDKCYLCERKLTTDYEVEHLVSQKGDASKMNEWDNLFVACNYCNDRKKENYDEIPLPNSMNFEDVIQQDCDIQSKKMAFTTSLDDVRVNKLISLLEKLYNGKSAIGRNLMEQRFWNQFMTEYGSFLRRLNAYINDPNSDNYQLVAAELHIDSPILGIKYNYIKCHTNCYSIFKNEMKWHKEGIS